MYSLETQVSYVFGLIYIEANVKKMVGSLVILAVQIFCQLRGVANVWTRYIWASVVMLLAFWCQAKIFAYAFKFVKTCLPSRSKLIHEEEKLSIVRCTRTSYCPHYHMSRKSLFVSLGDACCRQKFCITMYKMSNFFADQVLSVVSLFWSFIPIFSEIDSRILRCHAFWFGGLV